MWSSSMPAMVATRSSFSVWDQASTYDMSLMFIDPEATTFTNPMCDADVEHVKRIAEARKPAASGKMAIVAEAKATKMTHSFATMASVEQHRIDLSSERLAKASRWAGVASAPTELPRQPADRKAFAAFQPKARTAAENHIERIRKARLGRKPSRW